MKTFFLRTLPLATVILLAHIASVSAQSAPTFNITDGKSKQSVLSLETAQTEVSAGGLSVQRTFAPAQKDRPASWKFTVKNNSDTERWLHLNWEAAWSGEQDENRLRYWSGKGEPVTGAALRKAPSSDASLNTSMLQAVYDENSGLALALPPDQIVSQFEQSLQSGEGNTLKLRLQIPLVLDAG